VIAQPRRIGRKRNWRAGGLTSRLVLSHFRIVVSRSLPMGRLRHYVLMARRVVEEFNPPECEKAVFQRATFVDGLP